MMLLQFLGTADPGPPVFLTDTSLMAAANDPSDATCLFRLNNSGIAERNTTGSYLSEFTWLLRGASGDYEARMTTISGTLTTGTAGTWEALSLTRTWGKTRTGVGISTYSGTLEIRDASTLVVLASCTVTLTAEVEV
jgi:hypothetical protein